MKKGLKKWFGRLHLWLGLITGSVVVVVALTGCILVFEEELEPLIHSEFHRSEIPSEASRVGIDREMDAVLLRYPANPIIRISLYPEPGRNTLFSLKPKNKEDGPIMVSTNPYTGQIAGARMEKENFFEICLQLHRYLCLGETGKVITGISCVCFLVILVSGLVLWWPSRKSRKQRFRIKWNASPKRRNWDLHAVAGFYMFPVIFVIGLTGLVWSYKWVNNLIFYALDGKPQQKREAPANPDTGEEQTKQVVFAEILDQIDVLLPVKGKVLINIADNDSIAVTVSKYNEDAGYANVASFFYFDSRNGALVSSRTYESETPGFRARRLIYPIHTGSLWGLPTQILAFLAALGAATLPVTGFVVWWGKNRKQKKSAKAYPRSAAVAAGGVPGSNRSAALIGVKRRS